MKLTRILSAACGGIGLSAFLLFAAGPAPTPALPASPTQAEAVTLTDESGDASDAPTPQAKALARIELMSQSGLYSGSSVFMAKEKVARAASQTDIDNALINLAKTAYGKSYYITSGSFRTNADFSSRFLTAGEDVVTVGQTSADVVAYAWTILAPSENITIDDINKVIIQSTSDPTKFWGTYDSPYSSGVLHISDTGSPVTLLYVDHSEERLSTASLQPTGLDYAINLSGGTSITGYFDYDPNSSWVFTPAELKKSTASETHWYTIKNFGKSTFLSSDGIEGSPTKISALGSLDAPIQLWKVQDNNDGDPILIGLAKKDDQAAVYVTKSDNKYVNTATPTPAYPLATGINNTSLAICQTNAVNSSFCAQNGGLVEIVAYGPYSNDWKNATWVFEEVDPEYLVYYQQIHYNVINKTTDGYYISDKAVDGVSSDTFTPDVIANYTAQGTVDIYAADGTHTTAEVSSNFKPADGSTIVVSYTSPAHIEAAKPTSLTNGFSPYVNVFIWDCNTDRSGFRNSPDAETPIAREINYPDDIASILWVLEPTGGDNEYKFRSVKHGGYIGALASNTYANATQADAVAYSLSTRSDGFYDIKSGSTYWNGDGSQNAYHLVGWSDGHPYLLMNATPYLYYEVTENWIAAEGVQSGDLPSTQVSKVAPGEAFTSTTTLTPGLAVQSTAYSADASESDLSAVTKDITITYTVGTDKTVKPITLLSNGRNPNAYVSVSDDGTKLSSKTDLDASTVWIPYPVENEDGKYTLFNPYINKYLASIPLSGAGTLTDTQSQAAKIAITTDSEGRWILDARSAHPDDNTYANYHCLHMSGSMVPVGWESAADASTWTVAYPDAETINGYTADMVAGPTFTDELATSIANTGILDGAVTTEASQAISAANAQKAAFDASTLTETDAEKAALKISDYSGAIARYRKAIADIDISGRKIILINNRQNTTGCTANNLDGRYQYKYCGYIGVNGTTTLNFAGPVNNTQSSFEIVDNKLYLKIADHYVKADDASTAINMVAAVADATPVTIQKNGDAAVIVLTNGKGALNIPSWGTNLVSYSSLTDEGAKFTIKPFEDFAPQAGGEGYYFIMTYSRWFLSSDANSGAFLTVPFTDGVIPAEGTLMQHTTVSPLAIWKITPGSVDGAVHFESLADGYYLGQESGTGKGVLSKTPADWFITANGANNGTGYSIRVASDGQGLDAANNGSSVALWTPSTGDWQGTNWVFAPVNEEYVAECRAQLTNIDVLKAEANSRLDNLKLITQLFDAADIDAAKTKVAAAETEDVINDAVDEAIKTAAGKTIYIYVTKSGTTDNYYITDMGQGEDVKGVFSQDNVGENDAWAFEAVADGIVLKNTATGRYLSKADHFQTTTNVADAVRLDVNSAADGSYIYITVPAAGSNNKLCFNGNNGYIEYYSSADPHNKWHLETVRVNASQTDAIATLEALKAIDALYNADDIDAAIAEIEALDSNASDLAEKIDAIVTAAKQKADGKTISMWVQYQTVTPNAPRWMTDVDGKVRGVADATTGSYWTLRLDSESGLYRLRNNTGAYMGPQATFTTVAAAKDAGLFDIVPLDGGTVAFSLPDLESDSKYLNINRNAAITLYTKGDPHSKWHLVSLEQDLELVKEEIAAAKEYVTDLPDQALLSGSAAIKNAVIKDLNSIDLSKASGSDLIGAIVEARNTVGQADDIVETILEQRTNENRGLPFQIHRTSRDGETDVFLAINNNKVVVLSDASDPATLWIANFTKPETTSAPAARIMAEGDDDDESDNDSGDEGDDDEGDIYFTLFNPAKGLYIQSTPTSTALALTQNAEDAALFTLNPGDGGVAFYNGETPNETNSAIHLAAGDNIVGWTGIPEYSMWMMKDVTAAEVNAMGEAAYPSTGGSETEGMSDVITSLKNTALWAEETVDALDDVAANGFEPNTDKKAAAASFGNAGAVSRQSLLPITSKRFGLSNKRLFNSGLTGTPAPASQHEYASFIGINTDGTALVTSAPTTKAQWSFNVVGTDLFIINHRREGSTDISQYLKESGGALSLVSTPDEASPISIADDGDIVFPDGKVLTINDATLAMTTADDTDDEGTGFTYYGLRDVINIPDSYFAIMSYNRGGFLTSEHPVSGEGLIHGNFNDQAVWKLEKANDNGGYYIANFVEGLYLGLSGSNPIITTNKTVWYLTDNAAKNGRGFAIRVSATGNGLDAANQSNGVGLYIGYINDWQGTTWDFAPVPDALLESKTAAKEALYQTIVNKMPSRIEQLRAVPTLFDESQIDKTLASFTEISADETLSPKEKANLMEAEAQTLFAYAQEVPFMLINKRRYDNAMIAGNGLGDKGYALYHYQTVDEDGYLDKYEFRTGVRTNYRAIWRLEYAGQGTFHLKAGDEAWIGAIPGAFNTPFNAVYAADAYHGRFIFVDNTVEGGEKTFAIAQYGHSLEEGAADNYLCVNITQDGEDGVVRYSADDAGSRWVAMLPSETLNNQEDVDGVYVISSYKRASKLLGVAPGVMVNPTTTPVSSVDPGPGAFWQLTKTGDQTYTLHNLFTDFYLAHDLTWSEEPVEWFITPNAASDEDWKSSNLGLSISVDEQRSKCIDMGGNGALSLWRPSANDFEGTTWVITRADLSTASKMALTNYKTDKAKYEAAWIPDYLGEVAEMVPSWASEPLFSAKAEYAEIKADMGKNTPAAINYVELLARRNALWDKLQNDLNKAFIEDGSAHAIQLINNRRADRFNEFNTEHLLAATSAGASMVSYDDNRLESSTIWHIQPSDDGTSFHITTDDGKYLGGADAPASLVTDKAKAGKFNIRYVIYSTYEDGDYQPNYGIALAYAGANTGLHGALTTNAPMNYYVTDPGSFWRLNNADFLGIDNVTVSDGSFDLSECDLFTLDGRRINRADAAPGIYVARRADGRAVKVVIR